MNLTAMLREGSLTDLRWYQDGMIVPGEVTFDPVEYGSKNPNNVKPEAQDQWGYGDISHIFDEDIAGTVDRHIPDEDLGDASPVVVFARHLMNQGATAPTVDRELKARFTRDEMQRGLRGLKKLFAMDGIIGRIAVDATGYSSCENAVAAAANSPYKHFIKFVIGCSCGDPHMVPAADGKQELVASTGNPLDDFMADDEPHQVKLIAHCQSTMLPRFEASIDDLDEQWMDELLITVENLTGLPGDEAKRIRQLDVQPLEKIQKAFKALELQRTAKAKKRYSEPVDASEHVIKQADNEIELASPAQPDIDIDPVNHSIQQDATALPEPELLQAGADMPSVMFMDEVEVMSAAKSQLDGIELSEAGDISLAERREAAEALDVDPAAGDNIGEEMPDLLSEIAAVDMTMAADGIFKDADVIELEPEHKPEAELDVDMKSDFQW
jgi:hypothetical protein